MNVKHGLAPTILGQHAHSPSCLFKEPDAMEPTIQQWMCMRDRKGNPMWIRADGSTRRTSPYRVRISAWR
eukprot:10201148-Prorocentrum_lima.AAC.1